ncbi:MAG: GNAT family N-acetyltransferase [Steroidobacteraceae bacterium]|jgi:ribosomal protein S18 acetylase RimI-like enzyme|nr:GNAT family N-acetyltransferase [Steroidobacteraceae bacterium]
MVGLAFAPATANDAEAVAALVNSAYRGDSSRAGWTTEADLLGGQRTDADAIRDLVAKPGQVLLLAREAGELVGSVHLERKAGGDGPGCYLGMLTVRPTRQAGGLGRALLAAAEAHARDALGARYVEMTVIDVRTELIAWYERRGYRRTGEQRPFPYGDARFGLPKRPDLRFVVLEKRFPHFPRVPVRTVRGRIDYLHDEHGETGREWFAITVQPDGSRLLRVQCEMDDDRVQRDMTYLVGADWAPRHAYLHLMRDGAFFGASSFRFGAGWAECGNFGPAFGGGEAPLRVSRLAVNGRASTFPAHPIVTDAWQTALWRDEGPRRQPVPNGYTSSAAENGATPPELVALTNALEYVGAETVDVPAGRFDCRHFRVHLTHYEIPLEIWTFGEDCLPARLAWTPLRSRYDLVELRVDA